LVRDAIVDSDNYCRKVGIAVLKNDLKAIGNPQIYSGILE
jgi:hypothetical protein